KMQPIDDLLDDWHAAQHLRLAGHHCVGYRISLEDALQLTHLVLCEVIKECACGRIAGRDLSERTVGQQRTQDDRCEQPPLAAPDGPDRCGSVDGHVAAVWSLPCRPPVALYQSGFCCRSVEHQLSCSGIARWAFCPTGLPDEAGVPVPN